MSDPPPFPMAEVARAERRRGHSILPPGGRCLAQRDGGGLHPPQRHGGTHLSLAVPPKSSATSVPLARDARSASGTRPVIRPRALRLVGPDGRLASEGKPVKADDRIESSSAPHARHTEAEDDFGAPRCRRIRRPVRCRLTRPLLSSATMRKVTMSLRPSLRFVRVMLFASILGFLIVAFSCLWETTVVLGGRAGNAEIEIGASYGTLTLLYSSRVIDAPTFADIGWLPSRPALSWTFNRFPGILFVAVPLVWPSCLITFLAGASWISHHRTDRITPAERCRQCGFDLTGIGDRPCPECGACQWKPDYNSGAEHR